MASPGSQDSGASTTDGRTALFSIDPQTHLAWFQPASMVPLYKYQLFGVLFALAIYNGVTLPVSFPLVLYRKLLGLQCEPSDLWEAWPSQARSLQAICEYDGSVEVDLARDYTFSFAANGLYVEVDMEDPWKDASSNSMTTQNFEAGKLKVYQSYPDRHHPDRGGKAEESSLSTKFQSDNTEKETEMMGITAFDPQSFRWPGWIIEMAEFEPPAAVTNSNRDEYSKDYTRWLIDYSVRPQFTAFAEGFHTVLDPKALKVREKAIYSIAVALHYLLTRNPDSHS